MQSIPTATRTPHVPHRIRMNTIRDPTIRICKHPPVPRVLLLHDIEPIDRSRPREIRREELRAGIRYIQRVQIGRELDAVGLDEAVGDDPDLTRGWRIAVDLAWNGDSGAEVLVEAVLRVGEPDVTCDRVLFGVVER